MSSALMNHMVHVHMKVSASEWLTWATANAIHPLVLGICSSALTTCGARPAQTRGAVLYAPLGSMLNVRCTHLAMPLGYSMVEALAYEHLTPQHAAQFKAFGKLAA